MATPPPDSGEPVGPARAAAADWLARRDRGLTAAEQDDYLQWLASDPRHPALMARQEATFALMRRLALWQPGGGGEPNPELFAPVAAARRRRRAAPWWAAAAAVVALMAGGYYFRTRPAPAPAASAAAESALATGFLRVNERRALPDGSLVELKDGSRIDVEFSPAWRRVRLVGEAHFTVAKDPTRPFVVEAGGVAVRAVGTAFNVRLEAGAVDVLVTEGTVRVGPAAAAATLPESLPAAAVVEARQRTVVSLAPTAAAPAVVSVTPEQIREALDWQAPRLQFFETPLGEAVAEFNRRNPAHRLVLQDPELARERIGGTFRIDNVEGFVRLLEVTLGIHGESSGAGEIRLRRLP